MTGSPPDPRPVAWSPLPWPEGPSTPDLVVAAVVAGSTGFLAGGYLSAECLQADLDAVAGANIHNFGVNLFVPERQGVSEEVLRYQDRLLRENPDLDLPEPRADDDPWEAKLRLLLDKPVAMVSFTFGFPDRDVVEALHEVGSTVIATVSTTTDATVALQRGADVLCVQGPEAGGHRATFDQRAPSPTEPLIGLVAALHGSAPIIAAGGVSSAPTVESLRAAGAAAVQIGTTLLLSDKAGTDPTHRQEITAGRREVALTRAFSGRWARGLLNDFIRDHPNAPTGYPFLNQMTGPIRAQAKQQEDPEKMSLWAGTRYRDTRPGPAGEIIERLWRGGNVKER